MIDSEVTLQQFEKAITNKDGCYHVLLPWKKTEDLADNLSVATKCLGILMHKLNNDHSLLERHHDTKTATSDHGVLPGNTPCSAVEVLQVYVPDISCHVTEVVCRGAGHLHGWLYK